MDKDIVERRPEIRCDECDNGVAPQWEFCPWCGVAANWEVEPNTCLRAAAPEPNGPCGPYRRDTTLTRIHAVDGRLVAVAETPADADDIVRALNADSPSPPAQWDEIAAAVKGVADKFDERAKEIRKSIPPAYHRRPEHGRLEENAKAFESYANEIRAALKDGGAG